ncbi:RNA-guided endonuclease TnpB family protein [Streptomyces coeruleorubidus]|uniref:RNA-guided endonuclease InsQ/TnpB family protein n=1 Tax=Streptomyces coeruleorubidus TaxID=116188 RepID=UPI00237F2A50|nr:RNA-guided endonuclease TnpB family protein [Streptomyces coeruleorubidus]WDV55154.1 RNA-guided endonuclease TnpB family protein [Streptomyces coeruleorubidus]
MATHVKRAFKYRFYPTDAQAAELSRTFGCARKVYNMALAARTEAWARQERVNYNQTSAMLTEWKKTEELAYLNDVSSVPLQQALRHLQTAFTHFFAKRSKYPRFKSRKKSRRSAEYTTSAFRFRDGRLTLAKMSGPLNIVWSRPLPEAMMPSTVTVSQDSAGRWFVSLLCEDSSVKPLPPNGGVVGIDAGLDHLLTLSTGEKITNPRHERRDRMRLGKAQRELSRKKKGSKNREKARRRVARVHARITDRRRDHLHKITTRLVRENQTLVIEDLTVRNLLRNGRLARAISDAAWAEFRSMLEYKANWYGREVITVDRFFPSSKLCSACGALQDRMPLHVRAWTCDRCGTTHDRDVNAANNLLAAGLAASACGAGVRPQRRTPSGQSATKQEVDGATRRTPLLRAGEEVKP